MPRLSLAVLLLVTTFLSACKSKYDEEMPADFSFVIIASHYDSYDSSKGIYTKFHTGINSNSQAHIPLSMAKKKAFYQAFCEADFQSFPEYFECFGGGAFPYLPEELIIYYKGTVQKVTYNPTCDASPLEIIKVKRYKALRSQLKDWIYNQKAVKELPDQKDIILL
ncbi:hypothetical protein [Siphonobacter curvatus]|uniref:Lipoprotein n=1 Tax=Siphonobacter curvatus TaxID=2094562 RepID=A0A2S7IPQ8_9BACT|nr:hypothetical protein [Siphonobacter curvatus]PQA59672.1 hypothetical protein C5O19_08575 [Siphonobacter curvatus]